jgi:cytoskeletal protein CcmA (bactofilin family)
VIEGRFNGILLVSELLNVRETAEVDGEITTNKLLVQSGARFNVTCKMESGSANGALKNAETKPSGHAAATVAGGKTEVRN